MKEDDVIELTYEIICRTPVCMLEHSAGNEYVDKVGQFEHDCEEAMEEQMRHWGDFTYSIDCVRDRLIDYTEDEDECIKIENDYRSDYIMNNDKAKQVIENYTNEIVNIAANFQENERCIETWDVRPILEEFTNKLLKTL